MRKHLGSIATGLIFVGLLLPVVPWEYFRPAPPPVTPLHQAAERGDVADATRLLDRGAAVDARDPGGLTPLHLAARAGAAPLVGLLIRRGGAVDARDGTLRTPLHYTSDADVARRLIAAGADVRARARLLHEFAPLHAAVAGGDLAMIQVLVEHGALVNEPNPAGHTPLGEAARLDGLAAARYLVRSGADINGRAPGAWTPLMLAAAYGPATASFLTARGADVRLTDGTGVTALHSVTDPHVAQLLISRGADLHAVTKEGRTPLHYVSGCSPKKAVPVLRVLIGHGVGINDINRLSSDNGETPLHVAATAAARFGDTSAVELLLKRGAAVNVRDDEGRTPLAVVLRRDPGTRVGRRRTIYINRRDAVARLLRRYGAAAG